MTTVRQETREYLLGHLPAHAADELDARLFAEDDLLSEVQSEEDALIEDFLRDKLTDEEATSFRAQIARSPALQEKVGALRILLGTLERWSTRISHPAPSRFPWILFWVSPALTIILCFVIVLYVKESRRNIKLNAQLVALSHPSQPISASIGANSVAVAFLSANVVRGRSALPEIATPATALVLELQIELTTTQKNEDTWNAEVRRDDEPIWKSSQMMVHRIGHETFLGLFMDARGVRPGTYEVRYAPSSDPKAFQRRFFQVKDPR
jgi:hypothetical protein